MASQPAPFTELFSSAITLVRERFRILLPGIILFVVLSALLFVGGIMVVGSSIVAGGAVMQGGDIAAAVASGTGLGLLMAIVGIVAYLYYLLAITQKETSFGTLLGRTFPRILPMIWMSILMMIRSFTWIALLSVPFFFSQSTVAVGGLLIAAGVICGIVFGPRYMLAPVIWIVEKKSVSESVSRSYAVTEGYWGKVVGNVILLMLIAFAVTIIVNIVAGIIGGIAGTAGDIVEHIISTVVHQVYQVVMIAFLLKLSVTLIAHPRSSKRK